MIFIAHYIDDLRLCNELGWECFYSFSARDYFEMYDACDLVISPRVHGCGMAASLGIPSIAIPHDGRISTVSGFGAMVAKVGEAHGGDQADIPDTDDADGAVRLRAQCSGFSERAIAIMSLLGMSSRSVFCTQYAVWPEMNATMWMCEPLK